MEIYRLNSLCYTAPLSVSLRSRLMLPYVYVIYFLTLKFADEIYIQYERSSAFEVPDLSCLFVLVSVRYVYYESNIRVRSSLLFTAIFFRVGFVVYILMPLGEPARWCSAWNEMPYGSPIVVSLLIWLFMFIFHGRWTILSECAYGEFVVHTTYTDTPAVVKYDSNLWLAFPVATVAMPEFVQCAPCYGFEIRHSWPGWTEAKASTAEWW